MAQVNCGQRCRISECAPSGARTAAPWLCSSAFVAVAVEWKNATRRVWFWNLFGRCLASSLKILCIPCELLADFLQIICKCLASSLLRKFLERSLQVFCIVSGLWRFGWILEFNARSDAKRHWKSFKMEPERIQKSFKNYEPTDLTLQAAARAQGCFRSAKNKTHHFRRNDVI